MSRIFGALEKMESAVGSPEDDQNVDQLDEVMLAVMESEQEFDDEADSLEEMDELVEEGEDAVENLTMLAETIEKYGISKPMMLVADPKGELVAKGIVGSYEELEDVPVKDENAEAAVEGIKDTIVKLWKRLAEFVMKIWNKITEWISKAINMFRNYEKALTAMIGELKSATLDAKKMGDLKVSTYSKKVFDTRAKDTLDALKFVKMIVSEDENTKKLRAIVDGSEESAGVDTVTAKVAPHLKNLKELTKSGKSYATENKTLPELGWKSSSDVVSALETALDIVKKLATEKKSFEKAIKDGKESAKTYGKAAKNTKDTDESADLKRRQQASQALQKLDSGHRAVINLIVTGSNKVARAALTIGRAALKAKTK